jgi:hypothetical protein
MANSLFEKREANLGIYLGLLPVALGVFALGANTLVASFFVAVGFWATAEDAAAVVGVNKGFTGKSSDWI